ncbi:hypothetical protein J6590_044933 [Homalodisca vitripennis]|nr:hypothetical protein J6590_044933 [Homalodisca vitripennis]
MSTEITRGCQLLDDNFTSVVYFKLNRPCVPAKSFASGVQQLLEHKSLNRKTGIVVPASRFFTKLQNGGALPMPLPVLPDPSATDKLTRRFSSFADCMWNCCAYVVKLVFDILGRCVVCTCNGLRKETISVCETCTSRPNLYPDTCFKTTTC